MPTLTRSLLGLLFAVFAFVPAAPAQESDAPVEAPMIFRGVSVWQGPGRIEEGMTVVIHDAFTVEFLSGSVDPADYPEARVIDAEDDWILYPGRIHANFPSGRGPAAQNSYRGSASDPTDGPIPAMEYGDHASFFAWSAVADGADWDPQAGDDWRASGFTSAYLLPNRGLVQGRAAHLALNGLPLGEAILQRDGWQILSLRASGGYPRTAMAALAMLRQLLLDQDRPGLSPDLQLGTRRIFRASGARVIENFLDLQRDFDDGNE
jgi:hypothetical protein